jgi:hypothetical protein
VGTNLQSVGENGEDKNFLQLLLRVKKLKEIFEEGNTMQPMTPVRAIQVARQLLRAHQDCKADGKPIMTDEEELAIEQLIAIASRVAAGFLARRP